MIYLFDFDGTLVDSMPAFAAAITKLFDDHRIPYGPETINAVTPLGLAGLARYLRQLGLDTGSEETIASMKKTLLEAYWYHIPAKENVPRVLRALREKGDEMNILTGSPHMTMDVCLKRLGIFDLFQNIWPCDEFGTTKSDPAVYAMAAEKLGKPTGEITFLDDNLDAIRTAKAAGMRTIGVYDPTSAPYEKEIRAAADGYIMNFDELLKFV